MRLAVRIDQVWRCLVDECVAGQAHVTIQKQFNTTYVLPQTCNSAGRWTAITEIKTALATGACAPTNVETGYCCPGIDAIATFVKPPGCVCPSTSTAVVSGNVVKCLSGCTAGPTCVGNAVQVCDVEGLQITSTTPCGASETCDGGLCKPWVCTPGAVTGCADIKTKSICNADGLGTAPVQCAAQQSCTNGTCEPWVCYPKLPVCDGNTPAIGADDGLSVIPTGTTCNSACLNGACIDCDAVNQCQIGPLLWQFTPTATDMAASDAQAYCENLDLAGYTDWRLPVFQETDGGSINASYDWILPGESFLMGMPLALEPTFDLSATYLRGPVGCPSGGKCTAMGLKVFSNTVSNGKKILKMGMIGKFVETGRVRCVRP